MEWLVVVLVVLAALGVSAYLLSRRAAASRRRPRGVHTLERERSIGYFQDLSGRSPSGVQEDDEPPKWGSRPDDDVRTGTAGRS